MGSIYVWDGNKARLDTRPHGKSLEAVIYPPEGITAEQGNALEKTLREQGYELARTMVGGGTLHHLEIQALSAEKKEALRAHYEKIIAKKTAELTGAFEAKKEKTLKSGLHFDEERELAALEASKPQLKVTEQGLELVNIGKEIEVQGHIRWISRRHPEVKFNHTSQTIPATPALHVRKEEGAERDLISLLELQGWARGTRVDEFFGMSPASRTWAKAVKDANIYAPLFYMLGDSQVVYANALDARRRGIGVLEHEGFWEGMGFLGGSGVWLTQSLLNQPQSTESVMHRFETHFRTGEQYDFGKHQGANSSWVDDGRLITASKDVMKNVGFEILALLNTAASVALLRTGSTPIIKTEKAGGFTNVVLDAETGEHAMDRRALPKNIISGGLLFVATLIMAFVPRIGSESPFVNYLGLGDKIGRIPVLGDGWRAASRFLAENPVGQKINAPFARLWDWVAGNPNDIASKLILGHNVQQVAFNTLNLSQLVSEQKELVKQMGHEQEMLQAHMVDNRKPLPPAAGGKPPHVAPAELPVVHKALSVILDLKREAGISEPQNKPETEAYQQKIFSFKNGSAEPQHYLDYIQLHRERMKDKNYVPSEADEYIYIKAMNRLNLDEVHQQIKSITFKYGGYGVMTAGTFLLKHSGEQFKDQVNAAEASVNLTTVIDKVAAVLKEQGATTPDAIANAASFLQQDVALKGFGLGVEAFVGLLTEKIEGRVTQKDATAGIWNKASDALVVESSREAPVKVVGALPQVAAEASVQAAQVSDVEIKAHVIEGVEALKGVPDGVTVH